VADVSISDGTFMEPEQSFVKIWKMRNEGTKAWEEGTRLAFVGGDKLSAIEYVSVPAVNAGDEIDISVDMVSPSRAGRYIGYWRLSSPDGTRFGQRVWVDVVVSPSASTSASAPAAASPSSLPTVVQSNSVAPVPAKDVMEVESQPKVAPVVIATPAEEEPVSTEVQQLMDMGFTNKALNRQLLEANRNDIFKVVQILLNNLN
jgi:next-to-BRCA1 protein 1